MSILVGVSTMAVSLVLVFVLLALFFIDILQGIDSTVDEPIRKAMTLLMIVLVGGGVLTIVLLPFDLVAGTLFMFWK